MTREEVKELIRDALCFGPAEVEPMPLDGPEWIEATAMLKRYAEDWFDEPAEGKLVRTFWGVDEDTRQEWQIKLTGQ